MKDNLARWLLAADRVIGRLSWIALAMAAVALAVLVGLTVDNIARRLFLGAGGSLSFELGGLLLWPLAYYPVAHIYREEGHIRIDLVETAFPPRARQVMRIAAAVVVVAIALVMLQSALDAAQRAIQQRRETEVLDIPEYILAAAVLPLSMALFVLEAAATLVRTIRAGLTMQKQDFVDPAVAVEREKA